MEPSNIRVGPFDFSVFWVDANNGVDKGEFGECDTTNLAIKIDKSVDRILQLDTLLHEISHAIYWVYGLEDKDKEERIVQIMATGWTQVFRDNPILRTFIEDSCCDSD